MHTVDPSYLCARSVVASLDWAIDLRIAATFLCFTALPVWAVTPLGLRLAAIM